MAAPLQRSGEYDIFLKVVRLPSDQRWTFGKARKGTVNAMICVLENKAH